MFFNYMYMNEGLLPIYTAGGPIFFIKFPCVCRPVDKINTV